MPPLWDSSCVSEFPSARHLTLGVKFAHSTIMFNVSIYVTTLNALMKLYSAISACVMIAESGNVAELESNHVNL